MVILKALSKSLLFALLLTISGSQLASAEIKQYQYDGKLPFVQMMLNMMVAMGILDRIPVNGLYGSPVYPGSSLSTLNNPYLRALAMRGMSPGLSSSYLQNPYMMSSPLHNLYGGYANSGYNNNPFLSSPWLQSPWSQPALNTAGPLWGNPGWGVLPLESYSLQNQPIHDTAWQSQQWSASELSGWVNEPWETSLWNPDAENSKHYDQASPLPQEDRSADGRMSAQSQRQSQASPLSKLLPPDYRSAAPRSAQPRAADSYNDATAEWPTDSMPVQQKPCVTDFCGLKKPSLDGLWVAQNGEMLGIKNQRFLWSDGAARYLTGQLKIHNEYLLASVEGHQQLMHFKYRLAGNHLLTLQPDGVIREFTRLPASQLQSSHMYPAYGQGVGPGYGANY